MVYFDERTLLLNTKNVVMVDSSLVGDFFIEWPFDKSCCKVLEAGLEFVAYRSYLLFWPSVAFTTLFRGFLGTAQATLSHFQGQELSRSDKVHRSQSTEI